MSVVAVVLGRSVAVVQLPEQERTEEDMGGVVAAAPERVQAPLHLFDEML
jgi:hypothetical protein